MGFFRRLDTIDKTLTQSLGPGKCLINVASPLILSLLFSMQSGSASDMLEEGLC